MAIKDGDRVSVIFLTRKLQLYRIPIFKRVVELSNIKLTIGHSGEPLLGDVEEIDELILVEKEVGKFIWHEKNLTNLCNGFDAAVVMMYLQRVSYLKLLFSPFRKFKLAYWGIGVRASANTTFDSPTVANYARYMVSYLADASIFYTDYARDKYIRIGIPEEKLFVMQNTVEVLPLSETEVERNRLLFVGALYAQKRIDILLNAYWNACQKLQGMPDLHIIGGGTEFEAIQKWVFDKKMEDSVFLHGPIFMEEKLRYHFERSIACISPGQAGLSVLKSMGYGVPFVTIADAATGGERLNIVDKVNGELYSHFDDLESVLMSTVSERERWIQMGRNALKYYYEERTPERMAQGFIDAVSYIVTK